MLSGYGSIISSHPDSSPIIVCYLTIYLPLTLALILALTCTLDPNLTIHNLQVRYNVYLQKSCLNPDMNHLIHPNPNSRPLTHVPLSHCGRYVQARVCIALALWRSLLTNAPMTMHLCCYMACQPAPCLLLFDCHRVFPSYLLWIQHVLDDDSFILLNISSSSFPISLTKSLLVWIYWFLYVIHLEWLLFWPSRHFFRQCSGFMTHLATFTLFFLCSNVIWF